MPKTSELRHLLLDTRVWLWLVAGSHGRRADARRAINNAAGAGVLRIAAISLWELALLASHARIAWENPSAYGSRKRKASPVLPLSRSARR